MTDNVFAPPRSNVVVNTGPQELWDLSWKDLRNLYYASVNIRALGVLNVIGVVILAVAWMVPARLASSATPLHVVLGLLNFPIGTLISIIGLIAYVRGRRLFGEDKILHKDLAEVFKQRKVEKK